MTLLRNCGLMIISEWTYESRNWTFKYKSLLNVEDCWVVTVLGIYMFDLKSGILVFVILVFVRICSRWIINIDLHKHWFFFLEKKSLRWKSHKIEYLKANNVRAFTLSSFKTFLSLQTNYNPIKQLAVIPNSLMSPAHRNHHSVFCVYGSNYSGYSVLKKSIQCVIAFLCVASSV